MSTFQNREICPLLKFGGGQSSLNQKGNNENREISPLFKTGNAQNSPKPQNT